MNAVDTLLPRGSVRRVAVAFLGVLAVLLFGVSLTRDSGVWPAATGAIATSGAWLARACGATATAQSSSIVLATRTLAIDPACTAVTLIAVYCALLLAYPLSWAKKLAGLAIGIPVIEVANVVRLAVLAAISDGLGAQSFYIVHDYLFESAMVIVVLGLWAGWLAYARRTA